MTTIYAILSLKNKVVNFDFQGSRVISPFWKIQEFQVLSDTCVSEGTPNEVLGNLLETSDC